MAAQVAQQMNQDVNPLLFIEQINQHLKHIDNTDEIIASRAIVSIASIYRKVFVHIASIQQINEADSNLLQLWDLVSRSMNAVMDISIQASKQQLTTESSSNSKSGGGRLSLISKGMKFSSSMKAIEIYIKLVLIYLPYGLDYETGKQKTSILWKQSDKMILNENDLRLKCDELILYIFKWSNQTSQIFGSSSSDMFNSSIPEILCVNSCISSIALTSPFHYKKCSDNLQLILIKYKKYLSENDNIDRKIKKYNFKQTQKRLSMNMLQNNQSGGGIIDGSGEIMEEDEDDMDVIKYYQFLTVLNSIKNYALLLIRFGRVGVRSLQLSPVQERERFAACDSLAHVLASQHGMSNQVTKMLPGYVKLDELIGVAAADGDGENNSDEIIGQEVGEVAESRGGRHINKKLDPRRKNIVDSTEITTSSSSSSSSSSTASSQASKAKVFSIQGLDSSSNIKTLGAVPIDPLSPSILNQLKYDAWLRIFTYGDMDEVKNIQQINDHDVQVSELEWYKEKQYFRKSLNQTSHHVGTNQDKGDVMGSNNFQKFQLQLGQKSIFREASVVKLALLNDAKDFYGSGDHGGQGEEDTTHGTDTESSSFFLSQILKEPEDSYISHGILDNILKHFPYEIDLLLSLLYEIYEKEIEVAKNRKGKNNIEEKDNNEENDKSIISNMKSSKSLKEKDDIHKTYNVIVTKIIKFMLESKESKVKYKILKKFILDIPYIPFILSPYLASLSCLYSGFYYRYDVYGINPYNLYHGELFLKLSLLLLKVLSVERGGPILQSRIPAMECLLSLAICGHVLIPLKEVGNEVYLNHFLYNSLHKITPKDQEMNAGEGYEEAGGYEGDNVEGNHAYSEITAEGATDSYSHTGHGTINEAQSTNEAQSMESSSHAIQQYNEKLITDSVGKETVRKQSIKLICTMVLKESEFEMKPLIEKRALLMIKRLNLIASAEEKRKAVEREKVLSGLTQTSDAQTNELSTNDNDNEDKMKDDEEEDEILDDDDDDDEETSLLTANINKKKDIFVFPSISETYELITKEEDMKRQIQKEQEEPSMKKQKVSTKKITSSWAKAKTAPVKKDENLNMNDVKEGEGEEDEESMFMDIDVDMVQVRYLLELPLYITTESQLLFKEVFTLYAKRYAIHQSTSTALSAAADAARLASTSTSSATSSATSSSVKLVSNMQDGGDGEEAQEEVLKLKQIDLEVTNAVNNAKALFPLISGYIIEIIEKHIDVLVKYIDKDYTKLNVLREGVPVEASPLILLLFSKIASLETLSPSLIVAQELLNFASTMEAHFKSPNIRYIVPFLGACDRNKFAMFLPRLLPWTEYDLKEAIDSGQLAAMTASTPGPPLSIPEFERAVRYRINGAGVIGSEQANNCGAELVELMIRLGSSHTISNQPHMKRCLFTAFKVIITLDVISVSALQRVLLSFASQPRPPLFYMKFLYECSQNKPQLSQFICTQVIPLLIQHGVWSEKENWQAFMSLTKQYTTLKPPHCLKALLELPIPQLETFIKVNESSQVVLNNFIKIHFGGDINAGYNSGMASINLQVLQLLNIC